MTEEEIKKFAKEYVQNNTDESVNSFQGGQLQKAFIEGTDFMYYSNNEELKNQLTEKDKQIEKLQQKIDSLQSYLDRDIEYDIEQENKELKAQIEKMKCCHNCRKFHNLSYDCTCAKVCNEWEIKEND